MWQIWCSLSFIHYYYLCPQNLSFYSLVCLASTTKSLSRYLSVCQPTTWEFSSHLQRYLLLLFKVSIPVSLLLLLVFIIINWNEILYCSRIDWNVMSCITLKYVILHCFCLFLGCAFNQAHLGSWKICFIIEKLIFF